MIIKSKVLIIFLFLCFGCKHDEIPEVKPLLKTNSPVLEKGSNELLLSGDFILSGNYKSIRYGFELSEDGSFSDPIVFDAGSDNKPDKFQIKISPGLKPDYLYYVRAWAISGKYKVFGNTIEFHTNYSRLGEPDPIILKVVPNQVFWGDTVMIVGKYFDYFGSDLVSINGVDTKNWIHKDTIWAIIPNCPADQNKLNVTVKVNSSGINTPFTLDLIVPIINGLNKTDGQYPDTITLSGNYFSYYRTSVLVDDQIADIVDASKKSISFVVPFLKTDRAAKVELVRSTIHYPITTNFHYHAQSFNGLSRKSAWIGDTVKLYASNLDFRKIKMNIKNTDPKLLYGNENLVITKIWKDSLAFILKGSNDASQFNLDIQFGHPIITPPYFGYPTNYNYTTVDQKSIIHTPPLLSIAGNHEFVGYQTITWNSQGMYPYSFLLGDVIKSLNSSFSVSTAEYNAHPSTAGLLEPGDYSLQLYSYGRYSNTEQFTVKAPVLESSSPLTFERDDELLIHGSNLPVFGNYQFTHIQSGKSISISSYSSGSPDHTIQPVHPERLIGSGDYQLSLKIGSKVYNYPGTIHFNDYFQYVNKLNDPVLFTSLGCGFSVNNKLYIPRQSNGMSIIDIASGEVRSVGQDYYNYDHQPVFFNNNIYMNIYKPEAGTPGKTSICSFNAQTENWDEISMDGVSSGFLLKGFGVWNNKLIAFSDNGDLYQLDQKWTFIKNIKTNLYFIHFIHSSNEYLYVCDFYFGKIIVISTSNWNIVKTINMPGEYQNSMRYIFDLQGSMYYIGAPRGLDHILNLFKFTPQEQFEALAPPNLPREFYYHFCPDGKGNVWFVYNGYVYKFNPQ